MVFLSYSVPPYPELTTYDYSTQTGIYVDVERRSSVRVSAVLRKTSDIDLPALGVEACFGLDTPPVNKTSGMRHGGFGCEPLRPAGRLTRVTTEFEQSAFSKEGFRPGRYTIFVHLRGTDGLSPFSPPAEAFVEEIAYKVLAK